MAWLKPNQLSMFEPSTFPSEKLVTSSPASAVGHSLLTLPAGLAIAKLTRSCPGLPSRLPDRAAASLTNVICGPSGSGSSASIALARSLASRLKVRLDGRGSDLVFTRPGSHRPAPAGRSFSLLVGVAAAHPTPNVLGGRRLGATRAAGENRRTQKRAGCPLRQQRGWRDGIRRHAT